MRFLRRTLSAMSAFERWMLFILLILLFASCGLLFRRFFEENSELIPERGGTYIEGSVGTMRMLNPWFTVTNDVNRDITSLVFSGLQRYNPFSGQIEDDMAVLEIGQNDRVYTLHLRDNLFWHDSTEELPHPVTADDVIFTYSMIKEQGFPNPILQKNFRGVEIEKIDDHTVQFRLEKAYYFFRSNLTLGILPKHHFNEVPADRLLEALDFNLSPIGSGPYRFKSIVETELATEVTLELFPSFYGAKPYIERIMFRAFPDYPSLLSDLRNLDGVRHVPRTSEGRARIPNRYKTYEYTLPQYVALFFNMDREILQNKKLRLGMQLATNKQAIIERIHEKKIIDTPLLELSEEDWHYQFQPNAAQGALFDTEWHLPEKLRLQHLLEIRDRNATGALILGQQSVLLNTGAALILTGSSIGLPDTLFVNSIPVTKTGSGSWTVSLPTAGSGSIILGENAIRLTGSGSEVIDTFTLIRVADKRALSILRSEQELLGQYRSSTGKLNISDLGIDNSLMTPQGGTLRLRNSDEPNSIRRDNDGLPLHLTLLTSASPPSYPKVAEEIAKEWRVIGVDVELDIVSERSTFEDRVLRRDYDVLLFGQPLLDNLDIYPYWHSSQIQTQKRGEGLLLDITEGPRLDANNLSQYTDFRADALLEQIRETRDPSERTRALELLHDVLREDVPMIVLYSPTYIFAISEEILGVDLGKPSLHSDRFLGMHRWFIRQGKTLKTGVSIIDFFPWIVSLWRGA